MPSDAFHAPMPPRDRRDVPGAEMRAGGALRGFVAPPRPRDPDRAAGGGFDDAVTGGAR